MPCHHVIEARDMKLLVPDSSTLLGALLAAHMATPSQNISSLERNIVSLERLERGGWKIMTEVTNPFPSKPRDRVLSSRLVQSSDNFDGGDRKLAASRPRAELTPVNKIESSESKNQGRAQTETTSGNFSKRLLRDETGPKNDRNYSLGSISSRK